MKLRVLKSGISIFLASVLFLAPPSQLLAKEANTPLDTMAVQAVDTVSTLKEEAKKKADLLTTVYGITSVQYALIDNGKIILSGESGYNDVKSKQAPTKNTLYGIGSISKVVTTVGVLQLVEKGVLNLDTPVVTYIPEFKMKDSRYKDITVRMLLNHSSGLMGSTLDNSMLLGDVDTTTHDNFLNILSTQRLKADPGAFSVYCNDGFTLAEILIEKVTGLSFTKYISDYISTPLGLNNMKTPSDTFDTSRLAGIYNATAQKLPPESLCAYGAGGIYSTAEDLVKFSTIFTGSTPVLSPSRSDEMETDQYKRGQWYPEADSALSYGLGWDSVKTWPFTDYGIKALVKGGDTAYNHGSLIVLPEENMSMAVLSSGGSSSFDQIFAQSILLQALKEKGRIPKILPDKKPTAPVKTAIPKSLMKHAGYYGNSMTPLNITMASEGTLTISMPGQPKQIFIYNGDNYFYTSDGSLNLSFVEDKGNTYLLVNGYSTLPAIGQTASNVYQGQKLTPSELSPDVKKAWSHYTGKRYFIISEKYSSLQYPLQLVASRLDIMDGLPNYISSNQIVDHYTALAYVQIPGVYGRDLADITVTVNDGVTYLNIGATRMISEDGIGNLSAKKSFDVKIPYSGDAQYFKISKKSADKKITVNLPEKSSFTVYDSKDACVFSSHITGKNSVTLPKDGHIVFVGSPKATFGVTYK